jgi:hypothetical protein
MVSKLFVLTRSEDACIDVDVSKHLYLGPMPFARGNVPRRSTKRPRA